MRRALAALLAASLLAAACSDDGEAAPDPATTSTAAPTTTTTAPPEPSIHEDVVVTLAADEMEGREPGTPGSELAQEYLVSELEEFAEPIDGDFRHPFDGGVNVIGVVPGTDLAEEYLVLGAHYDHLGRDCHSADPEDDICNGATDNAAGVAAVLEIGRRLAAGEAPRRSLVLAFWDAEEAGLLGARHYVANPLVPLETTHAYVNWDIQGANLLPSLTGVTIAVGAETGGEALTEAVAGATADSPLDYLSLSLLFGQGRSDHAPFASAGKPIVFFTDANSACYHTAQDDLDAVDFDKLAAQIDVGESLVRDLADTDEPPAFVPDAPAATHTDAESMYEVVARAEPDLDRFSPEGRTTATEFLADLEAMVEDGADRFTDEDVSTLLGGSAAMVALLTQGECDSFT